MDIPNVSLKDLSTHQLRMLLHSSRAAGRHATAQIVERELDARRSPPPPASER